MLTLPPRAAVKVRPLISSSSSSATFIIISSSSSSSSDSGSGSGITVITMIIVESRQTSRVSHPLPLTQENAADPPAVGLSEGERER